MSSRGSITHQENMNLIRMPGQKFFGAFLLGNGSGQVQAVVGALATIGSIVKNE